MQPDVSRVAEAGIAGIGGIACVAGVAGRGSAPQLAGSEGG